MCQTKLVWKKIGFMKMDLAEFVNNGAKNNNLTAYFQGCLDNQAKLTFGMAYNLLQERIKNLTTQEDSETNSSKKAYSTFNQDFSPKINFRQKKSIKKSKNSKVANSHSHFISVDYKQIKNNVLKRRNINREGFTRKRQTFSYIKSQLKRPKTEKKQRLHQGFLRQIKKNIVRKNIKIAVQEKNPPSSNKKYQQVKELIHKIAQKPQLPYTNSYFINKKQWKFLRTKLSEKKQFQQNIKVAVQEKNPPSSNKKYQQVKELIHKIA